MLANLELTFTLYLMDLGGGAAFFWPLEDPQISKAPFVGLNHGETPRWMISSDQFMVRWLKVLFIASEPHYYKCPSTRPKELRNQNVQHQPKSKKFWLKNSDCSDYIMMIVKNTDCLVAKHHNKRLHSEKRNITRTSPIRFQGTNKKWPAGGEEQACA